MTEKQLQTSTKVAYVAPECEALEIKSHGVICQSIVSTSAIADVTTEEWGTLE